MKTRAAVAWKPKHPLTVEEIEIEGPKAGEVLVRMVATGVCHTDAFIQAFPEYLGGNKSNWTDYDANELVKKSQAKTPILIDQGMDDEFLQSELFIDEFEQTTKALNYSATIRRHPGYDHSYYFISTFIKDHFAFHAEVLKS